MSDFLLIHGSAHGAWCWDHLIPHLHAAGHSARAIDLPSHADDKTPASAVTLDSYATAIQNALHPDTHLVAHSMAGFPATLAADRAPDLVAKLIYLCAHIPEQGRSIANMRKLADSQPLASAMIPHADGITVTIDPLQAREKFYHDVAPEMAARAIDHLCPQPLKPQATPYPGTPNTSIQRHAIRCMHDHAIPYSYQRARTADWPADRVSDLPTSHSPFLSDPAGLAALLTRISES